MFGNGALIGMVFWRMVQIPKVLPRDHNVCYAAAVGVTMRPTVPRPAEAMVARLPGAITMASDWLEPYRNNMENRTIKL